jgi:hypothetical protein
VGEGFLSFLGGGGVLRNLNFIKEAGVWEVDEEKSREKRLFDS